MIPRQAVPPLLGNHPGRYDGLLGAESHDHDEDRDYIVISITDPEQRDRHDEYIHVHIPKSPRRLGVIELDFHDIDEPLGHYTLMSEEQARQVVELIQDFQKTMRNGL